MKHFLLLFVSCILLASCSIKESSSENDLSESQETSMQDFLSDAVIYEVNVRQYTPEGTFEAFEKHLPRLQKLGVDILWLMPIHEIGEENRKGDRGSYYSVKDYKSVNPNFGDKESFQKLVDEVHELGMKLILDWVPNHTAWDNVWVKSHPDFFSQDSLGNFYPPVEDWSDVIDLNYDNAEMRDSMIAAMKYWINDFDIDGYRCDVAGMVPLDFWQDAISQLNDEKEVFMLAEAEEQELYDNAFNMQYGWNLHAIMNEVAQGEWSADSLKMYFADRIDNPSLNGLKMIFTSNHDENTWKANAIDRMEDNYKNMIVLSFTVPGMPLIYSGQEAALDYELEFFEKDTITWSFDNPYNQLFHKMVHLKTNHPALSNHNLDNMEILKQDVDDVLVFKRKTDNNEVIVALNFSSEEKNIDLSNDWNDTFTNVFGVSRVIDGRLPLEGFQYAVFIKG